MEADMPTESRVSESFATQVGLTGNCEPRLSPEQPRQSFAPNTDSKGKNRSTSKKYRLWVVFLVLVMVAAGTGFAVYKNSAQPVVSPKQEAPVATVSTREVQLQKMSQKLTVNGSISAWDPLSIGAEVSGLRIDEVKVDDGYRVRKGQVLAILDSSVLKAQLEMSKANLASAEANIKKAIQPNRAEDINALTAALAQAKASVGQEEQSLAHAQANLENARHNAIRYTQLLQQGAVSAQDTETRQMNLAVAETDVHTAEQKIQAAQFAVRQASEHLLQAQRGGRTEDIQIARANARQIEADINRLQAQIAQTVIRAPDDGLILKRDAHIGDITAGKSLFSMVRANRLELRAQVAESDMHAVHPGQPVTITASDGTAKTVIGRLRQITPQIDATSRLGTIRIDVPAGSGFIPGMFVNADVNLGQGKVLAVPTRAVLSHDEQSFVFTLNDNHAKMQSVVTGAHADQLVQILSGLSAGQQIIVEGAGFLKDGDLVRVAH